MKNRVKYVKVSAAVVAATLVLTGCASPQFMSPEVEAVAGTAWRAQMPQASGAVISRADWWKAWNDAELVALIERAVEKNTDVKGALANLKNAAALSDKATADLFPSFDLGGGVNRSFRENKSPTNEWNAKASGAWNISLFGGAFAEQRASKYEAMSYLLTLEDVKNTVAGEVAANYVSIKLAMVTRRISEATLKNYEEAGEIADWRYRAGLIDQAEVDQAVSNRESARASLAAAQKSIAQYRNALARLTVQNAADVSVTDDGLIPAAPVNLAVAVPAETLKQRPDMRAAQLAVAAASDRVYKAKTQWFPSLTISGNIGTQAATISTLGTAGTGVAALAGALAMPLLNWGDTVTATQQAQAKLEKARADYLSTLLKSLEETENALTAIETAQNRKTPLATSLAAAESAAELTMKSYRSGLVDYQNVLTTQRTLLAARESTCTNDADLAAGLITLYNAMGGAWTPSESEAEVFQKLDAAK